MPSTSISQRIMPITSLDTDVWKYQPPVAELTCGSLAARIDVSQPQLGLHGLGLQAHPCSGKLFSVMPNESSAWPARLADAYVRGSDLVATYEAASDWPYAPTIYWRAEPTAAENGALSTFSLLVSIQTDLLDTHPRISVATKLPAEEVLMLCLDENHKLATAAVHKESRTIRSESATTGILQRLPGGRISYVEIAEANDFRQLAIEHDGGENCRSTWELFAEFLEKGVIRRARLHGAFLPRERDTELAAKLCKEIASRPLPLTT